MNRLLLRRGKLHHAEGPSICWLLERERQRKGATKRENLDDFKNKIYENDLQGSLFSLSGYPAYASPILSTCCKLPLAACLASTVFVRGREARDAEGRKEGGKEHAYARASIECARTSERKTTLSKEGFKDYQLRLLGNLPSCILPTSKRPLCAGKLQVGECGVCCGGWVGGRGGVLVGARRDGRGVRERM